MYLTLTLDGGLPAELKRHYKGVSDAMSRIVREEGVATLWRVSHGGMTFIVPLDYRSKALCILTNKDLSWI